MSLSSLESIRWNRRSYDKYTERSVSDGTLTDATGAAIADGTEVYRTVQTLSVYKKTLKLYLHSKTIQDWEDLDFSLYTVKLKIEYGNPSTGAIFTREYVDYTISRFSVEEEMDGPTGIVSLECVKYGRWYIDPNLNAATTERAV